MALGGPALQEPLGGEVERLLPADRGELAIFSQQRRGEAVGRILGLEEEAGAVAERASGDRVVGVSTNGGDFAVFDGGDDGVRAVSKAAG